MGVTYSITVHGLFIANWNFVYHCSIDAGDSAIQSSTFADWLQTRLASIISGLRGNTVSLEHQDDLGLVAEGDEEVDGDKAAGTPAKASEVGESGSEVKHTKHVHKVVRCEKLFFL